MVLACSREARIALSSPKRTHVDWNWPISREKYLKIDWSVKIPLHWLIMGVGSNGSNGLLKLSNWRFQWFVKIYNKLH